MTTPVPPGGGGGLTPTPPEGGTTPPTTPPAAPPGVGGGPSLTVLPPGSGFSSTSFFGDVGAKAGALLSDWMVPFSSAMNKVTIEDRENLLQDGLQNSEMLIQHLDNVLATKSLRQLRDLRETLQADVSVLDSEIADLNEIINSSFFDSLPTSTQNAIINARNQRVQQRSQLSSALSRVNSEIDRLTGGPWGRFLVFFGFINESQITAGIRREAFDDLDQDEILNRLLQAYNAIVAKELGEQESAGESDPGEGASLASLIAGPKNDRATNTAGLVSALETANRLLGRTDVLATFASEVGEDALPPETRVSVLLEVLGTADAAVVIRAAIGLPPEGTLIEDGEITDENLLGVLANVAEFLSVDELEPALAAAPEASFEDFTVDLTEEQPVPPPPANVDAPPVVITPSTILFDLFSGSDTRATFAGENLALTSTAGVISTIGATGLVGEAILENGITQVTESEIDAIIAEDVIRTLLLRADQLADKEITVEVVNEDPLVNQIDGFEELSDEEKVELGLALNALRRDFILNLAQATIERVTADNANGRVVLSDEVEQVESRLAEVETVKIDLKENENIATFFNAYEKQFDIVVNLDAVLNEMINPASAVALSWAMGNGHLAGADAEVAKGVTNTMQV